jgi:hypothetical protein
MDTTIPSSGDEAEVINLSISEIIASAITTMLADEVAKGDPADDEMRKAMTEGCLPMVAEGLASLCELGNFNHTSKKNALVLLATPDACHIIAYDLEMLLENPGAITAPPEADLKSIWGAVHAFLGEGRPDCATFAVLVRAGVERLREWQTHLKDAVEGSGGTIPIMTAMTVREAKEPNLERCGGIINLAPFPAKAVAFLHALEQAEREKGSGATIN